MLLSSLAHCRSGALKSTILFKAGTSEGPTGISPRQGSGTEIALGTIIRTYGFFVGEPLYDGITYNIRLQRLAVI